MSERDSASLSEQAPKIEMYRVLRKLSTGQTPGDLITSTTFKEGVAEKLLAVNALSPLRGPPLRELPGWATRAETLEALDIETAQDFLAADLDTLKDAFGYKTTRAINKWRDELIEWVTVPIPGG